MILALAVVVVVQELDAIEHCSLCSHMESCEGPKVEARELVCILGFEIPRSTFTTCANLEL